MKIIDGQILISLRNNISDERARLMIEVIKKVLKKNKLDEYYDDIELDY